MSQEVENQSVSPDQLKLESRVAPIAEYVEKKTGKKPLIMSTDCDVYMLEHKSCAGCTSHLECAKVQGIVKIMVAASQTMEKYGPMSILSLVEPMTQLRDRLMVAKTLEELKLVEANPRGDAI